MSSDLLQTKLYAPRMRPALVPRPRLIEKLDRGWRQGGKLTLVSAPAGFGKTTLVSEWLTGGGRPFAWLSLDEGDSDLVRFLLYFVSALQGISATVGKGVLAALQSAQTPPGEALLTALLNDIATIPNDFSLVLDDYHMVDSQAVDNALTFFLDRLPPSMHLVITTREDPNLPLARLRVRGQLTEVRASDLRFNVTEAADFLRQTMGFDLSEDNVAALEARTEGWIAGLQLASISLQGHQKDMADFIDAFTGSHRFVLDYLVEEVLHQQPPPVQRFLLQTSILDRLCGPLCDAVCLSTDGQTTLEALERSNLFLIPLDDDRRWYRYHHLFADLLRQRLQQAMTGIEVAELHSRASHWYETNGLELEAFHHAAMANDVERSARLIEGNGLPLYFRGEAPSVQNWLESLPEAEFIARPSLWVTYASVLTMTGRLQNNIEEILQKAETALQNAGRDEKTNDLLGRIAAIRAMLGVPKNQVETIITQSHRALDLLQPNNAPMRTTTTWALGYAYQVQGNRAAASKAYTEAITHSQASGNIMTTIAATTCLGQIQETENQLRQASETFQQILELMGDPPWPAACEACVGLARIHYQWNDLEAAEQYGRQGLALARQLENVDTPAACGVLLARVKLAQGDIESALTTLAEADQFVQRHHFAHWQNGITSVRIQTLLQQDNLAEAAQLAETYDLPISQARIHLAQGDPNAALAVLEPIRRQAEAKNWADERLQAMVLQALAYDALGDTKAAMQTLSGALALAAPGGLIRIFIDEGPIMAALLKEAVNHDIAPDFVQHLLHAFGEVEIAPAIAQSPISQPLLEPLTDREMDVLRLLATELTGPEIARELVVSLNTMRTHTKNIYAKLGVSNRRAAVRRAEELNLI
ncbi:MAG: tetratricopeptide repeat protein [Caldilineales bacterium]|nr:tetratricopeptide repeat protein [Caldilineales bacterium]